MQENLFFSREAMTYYGPLLESSMLTNAHQISYTYIRK